MQIVIDVPDEVYLSSKRQVSLLGSKMIPDCLPYYGEIINVIASGTPLPKGHGRLIDADALYEQYAYADYNFDMTMEYAPTIIEAESEG